MLPRASQKLDEVYRGLNASSIDRVPELGTPDSYPGYRDVATSFDCSPLQEFIPAVEAWCLRYISGAGARCPRFTPRISRSCHPIRLYSTTRICIGCRGLMPQVYIECRGSMPGFIPGYRDLATLFDYFPPQKFISGVEARYLNYIRSAEAQCLKFIPRISRSRHPIRLFFTTRPAVRIIANQSLKAKKASHSTQINCWFKFIFLRLSDGRNRLSLSIVRSVKSMTKAKTSGLGYWRRFLQRAQSETSDAPNTIALASPFALLSKIPLILIAHPSHTDTELRSS